MTKRDGYRLSDISSMEREAMLCPECHEFRLEEDPIASKDFKSKRDKLVHATRCANDACEANRVTPKKIKQQMPEEGRFKTFLWENGTVATVLVSSIAILLVGIAVFAAGTFAPPQPADVSGSIVALNEPQSDVQVSVTGNNTTRTTTTGAKGEFSFERLQPGKYTLRTIPKTSSEFLAPAPATVVVTDGSYYIIRGDGTRIPEPTEIRLEQRQKVRFEGSVSSGTASIQFADASNARQGVMVTLVGEDTTSTTQTVTVQGTGERTFFTPTVANNATVNIAAPVVAERQSTEGTNSGVEVISLKGNLRPENLVLQIHTVGTYPDVESRGEVVCSSDALSQSSGECVIPRRLVQQETVELVFEGQKDYDYTLNYTARSVARSLRFSINGSSYEFDKPDDSESWSANQTIERIPAGKNSLSLDVPDSGGLSTTASLKLTYDRTTPPPLNPSVTVQSPDGRSHTHVVPENRLSEGALTGKYTTTLPAEWFGSGSNKVTVKTQNSGTVYAVLTAQAVEEQVGRFNKTSD